MTQAAGARLTERPPLLNTSCKFSAAGHASSQQFQSLTFLAVRLHTTPYGGNYMLTKVIAVGAMAILVGCGAKPAGDASADADSSKPTTVAPAGFDNSKIAAAQTIPAGTRIHVRLDQTVDTVRSGAGEKFSATLEAPITVGEKTVVPKGTAFRG